MCSSRTTCCSTVCAWATSTTSCTRTHTPSCISRLTLSTPSGYQRRRIQMAGGWTGWRGRGTTFYANCTLIHGVYVCEPPNETCAAHSQSSKKKNSETTPSIHSFTFPPFSAFNVLGARRGSTKKLLCRRQSMGVQNLRLAIAHGASRVRDRRVAGIPRASVLGTDVRRRDASRQMVVSPSVSSVARAAR